MKSGFETKDFGSTVFVVVYLTHGTDKAYCVAPAQKSESASSRGIWVPKSAVQDRKVTPSSANQWAREEWCISKKDFNKYFMTPTNPFRK